MVKGLNWNSTFRAFCKQSVLDNFRQYHRIRLIQIGHVDVNLPSHYFPMSINKVAVLLTEA